MSKQTACRRSVFCAHSKVPICLFLYISRTDRLLTKQSRMIMFAELKKFLGDESGQDFGEYALIFGAIGVIAMAVIPQFREAVINAFQTGINALNMASGA